MTVKTPESPKRPKKLAPLTELEIFQARSKELFKPIDRQIMLCDGVEDFMALAAVMLKASTRIFTTHVGKDGAKLILEDMIKEL